VMALLVLVVDGVVFVGYVYVVLLLQCCNLLAYMVLVKGRVYR